MYCPKTSAKTSVCKTVTVRWPGQLEKEQFVRHPFRRQGTDCLQLIELKKKAKKYQSTTHPTWMQPISEATIERTFQAG